MAATCFPVGANSAQNNAMGIGRLGDDDIMHKRKFRYLFSLLTCNLTKTIPPHFVKVAARPSITIDEVEINFLNEKTWIPGKPAWDEITVTYYDVATQSSDNMPLFDWLATVYDFTSPCRWMASRRGDYKGLGDLTMLDGCGNILEQWTFLDMWPKAIKFGELDYGSTDVCEIELTMRYSKIVYKNFCGRQVDPCVCTPC